MTALRPVASVYLTPHPILPSLCFFPALLGIRREGRRRQKRVTLMYRTALMLPSPAHHCSRRRWQDSWARLLVPLALWLCVSVSLRYGYYGKSRIVLGPNSSRLFEASSVFVDWVEVVDDNRKGVVLYSFSEKPQLSLEMNWTVSNYLLVGPYNCKGFTLWLNKGSRIRMRWEAQSSHLDRVEIATLKGEKKYETLSPSFTYSPDSSAVEEPTSSREAEYNIEEDDRYYVTVTNTNPRRGIVMTMKVNVSSRMYDLTKARSTCSTSNGSCHLKLPFLGTRYIVLTTPNDSDSGDWYIDMSFVARIVTYVTILGVIVIFVFLLLKYLGVCDGETETYTVEDPPLSPVREATETAPMIPQKPARLAYGTNEDEDDDGGSSSSSEDLYDAKLCVICYDEQRNCFFVPCGHCATCYDCAQRIMESEGSVCPICRRPIHKVRRLFQP